MKIYKTHANACRFCQYQSIEAVTLDGVDGFCATVMLRPRDGAQCLQEVVGATGRKIRLVQVNGGAFGLIFPHASEPRPIAQNLFAKLSDAEAYLAEVLANHAARAAK